MDTRSPIPGRNHTRDTADTLTVFDVLERQCRDDIDRRHRANWFLGGALVSAILFDILLGILIWTLIA